MSVSRNALAHDALFTVNFIYGVNYVVAKGLMPSVIGPAGFDLSDRALKRAGMDYLEMAAQTRHVDWPAFEAWRQSERRRLVLFTTKAAENFRAFAHE